MAVLVYGASGTLGTAISSRLINKGFAVERLSTTQDYSDFTKIDPEGRWNQRFTQSSSINGIVFAQGKNANDDIFDPVSIMDLFEANLLFVINEISQLLRIRSLDKNCSIVIISSIWQNFARTKKLSYAISKSAISGLVKSLVADLGPLGIRINAILPGVIDSPMTRKMISVEVLNRVIDETPSRELVTDVQVAELTSWLISTESRGINGQFITIDNGWSSVRLI
jgi:NAD(P)-dependent dehydrogenase (short-subunit alcohol dehydrogenase family)